MPRQPARSSSGPKKSFHCKLCNKRARLPQGWNVGAAVRKHYWRHHPEVMRKDGH